MIYTKYIISLTDYLQFLIVWIFKLQLAESKRYELIFLKKYLYGGINKLLELFFIL